MVVRQHTVLYPLCISNVGRVTKALVNNDPKLYYRIIKIVVLTGTDRLSVYSCTEFTLCTDNMGP